MKLLSINVGQPRTVETARGPILTSIYKEPVVGARQVVGHNIEGDRQSDLTAHGGPSKAVYAYAWDHYAHWGEVLNEPSLQFGSFGENLTVEGLCEDELCIGDQLDVGTVRLRVTQPRMPCAKLALRFGRSDMVKLFWRSGLSGIYFAVEREGLIAAGDELQIAFRHPLRVSVADVVRLYKQEREDNDLFERVMAAPVSGSWKQEIQERRG
jgi:MOSC domain-containing protein YiiM